MSAKNKIITLQASIQADLDSGIEAHLATPAAERVLDLTLLGAVDLVSCFPVDRFVCQSCGNDEVELDTNGYTACCQATADPDGSEGESIDFVIVGCESGPKRRLEAGEEHYEYPFDDGHTTFRVNRWMSWLRSIIKQCDDANVKIHVKQIPDDKERRTDTSGRDVTDLPGLWDESDRIKKVGKIGWRVSTNMNEWPEWARRQDQ